MNRYVSCALGLVMAASAFSVMAAAPSVSRAPSPAVVKSPVAKGSVMAGAVSSPSKAFQQVKPCPFRRN